MSPLHQIALINLLEGMVIAYVLQRSGMFKSIRITEQFSFKDSTILKIFITTILTGAVGYIILNKSFSYSSEIMPTLLFAGSVGGFIIGLGMSLCKSEQVLAFVRLGSGRLAAGFTIAGIITASLVFKELYPYLPNELFASNFGVKYITDILTIF